MSSSRIVSNWTPLSYPYAFQICSTGLKKLFE